MYGVCIRTELFAGSDRSAEDDRRRTHSDGNGGVATLAVDVVPPSARIDDR